MNSFTHEPNPLLEHQRQQLEINLQQNDRKPTNYPSWLRHLWSRALQILIDLLDTSDEPRIYYETSDNSQVWKVYDPVAGHFYRFATEDEVRVWLEQRYRK